MTRSLAAVLFTLLTLTDAQRIERVKAYVAARERADWEAAKGFLAPDSRVWYEKREGEGEPNRPGAGRWIHWDSYFHGKTTYARWRVEEDAVLADTAETNDFYRLLDWKPAPMRFTWWLDAEGRVTGFLVQAMPETEATGSRLKDAVAWGKQKHPDEIAYLMPKERLDPTGDRAERWRKLLVEWRKAARLPEVRLAD